jgi:hypothetical protein
MLFLLFVPLAFIVTPVFSVEASTGMDNLILSSRHGRHKIVGVKIAAVTVAALVIASVCLVATFIFGFLSVGAFDGANAALRSIPAYVRAPFGFSNGQFALVAALWLLASGVVYALIVAFISSRTGNILVTFGTNLIVLFLNVGLSALGTTLSQLLSPITDFGTASIALAGEVFSGYKVYNLFGTVVPYYFMIILFMPIISALAGFELGVGFNSLNAEYAALYEEIISRYEAKLNCDNNGSIFDHNFPEATSALKTIDLSQLKHPLPTADKELIELLLAEYNICLDYLKPLFKEYESTVEKWFDGLPEKEKNA